MKKAKRLLQQREKELLRNIRSEWQDLKKNLYPQNILKEQIKKCEREYATSARDESFLKSTLSFVASALTRKLAKKAEERFERFFS